MPVVVEDNTAPLTEIEAVFGKVLLPLGLESHPFEIGWYNELVGPHFALDYPPSTLAYAVISGPDVFERAVLPYLNSRLKKKGGEDDKEEAVIMDPLDDSMVAAFGLAIMELDKLGAGISVDSFHDFQLHPSRKPKVLVQTAAHVAGAVQYFHKSKLPDSVQERDFAKESKLAGVAVHPVYGGWFAIRGVFIFKDVVLSEKNRLRRPPPLNLIPEEDKVVTLLKEFAYNWEEDKWRTVYEGTSSPQLEYSQNFKDFLSSTPGERWGFLKERGLI